MSFDWLTWRGITSLLRRQTNKIIPSRPHIMINFHSLSLMNYNRHLPPPFPTAPKRIGLVCWGCGIRALGHASQCTFWLCRISVWYLFRGIWEPTGSFRKVAPEAQQFPLHWDPPGMPHTYPLVRVASQADLKHSGGLCAPRRSLSRVTQSYLGTPRAHNVSATVFYFFGNA